MTGGRDPHFIPAFVVAVLVVLLAGWWLVGAEVQARITLLAGLLLLTTGALVILAVRSFEREDLGRVLPGRKVRR